MKRDEFLRAVSGNGSSQVSRFLPFRKLLSRVRVARAALGVLVSPSASRAAWLECAG